jgi:hypothetical protein
MCFVLVGVLTQIALICCAAGQLKYQNILFINELIFSPFGTAKLSAETRIVYRAEDI